MPSQTDLSGRDHRGRFDVGNRAGRGHPYNRRAAEFKAVILNATTPEKLTELWAMVWNKAMSGDMDAAKLVLSYIIGRPIPAPEDQPQRIVINVGLEPLSKEKVEEISRQSSAKFIEQRSDDE